MPREPRRTPGVTPARSARLEAAPAAAGLRHTTRCRVIYADTDGMGIVYHANYLRWFEIGRTEMFRALGLPYRVIAERGIALPVAEVYCRFLAPVRYDDLLEIETTLDPSVRGGVKFDYHILDAEKGHLMACGTTRHACLDLRGQVVRPPDFIRQVIAAAQRSAAPEAHAPHP
jgi:acyl-CoA thioester hydrolase